MQLLSLSCGYVPRLSKTWFLSLETLTSSCIILRGVFSYRKYCVDINAQVLFLVNLKASKPTNSLSVNQMFTGIHSANWQTDWVTWFLFLDLWRTESPQGMNPPVKDSFSHYHRQDTTLIALTFFHESSEPQLTGCLFHLRLPQMVLSFSYCLRMQMARCLALQIHDILIIICMIF